MTVSDPRTPGDSSANQRLDRVEEHLAFAEHTVDQLSEEIRALNTRMMEAIRRIDALERRLGRVVEKISSDDPTTPDPLT